MEILAVQETNLKDEAITEIDEYIFFNGGGAKNRLGTGFFIEKTRATSLVDFKKINERISYLRIRGSQRKLSIINVHAPIEDAKEEIKDKFYEELDELYEKIPNSDIKIIIGDFNAKVGQEKRYRPAVGKYSRHKKTNDNGQRLINFGMEKQLQIKATFLKHREIHKETWKSPDGRTKNQIDHLLIELKHSTCIENVKSARGAEIDSDHYLVWAKINQEIPWEKKIRRKQQKNWEVGPLQKDPHIKEEYEQEVEKILKTENKKEELEEEWKTLKETLEQVAKKLLPNKKVMKNIWFDDECKEIIEQLNKAKMKMLHEQTIQSVVLFKDKRKEAKKIYREKKRKKQEDMVAEIEENYNRQDVRTFYKKIGITRKSYRPKVNLCRDKSGEIIGGKEEILERWKVHYQGSMGVREEQDSEIKGRRKDEQCEQEVPTPEEFDKVIQKLRNNKTPGKDGIQSELIKAGGQQLLDRLYNLICEVWIKKTMPHEWREAVINPIYKKGDRLDCNNYRPISILNVAYKILATILNNRLKESAEKAIGEYQCGFRKNRSVTDQLFTLRQLQEKTKRKGITLHMLFIDYKQAYDSVRRKKLFATMENLELPKGITDLVKMTLEETWSEVKVEGENTPKFKITIGLRQGDPLSTTLFNIALEGVMRNSKTKRNNNILKDSYQVMAYADDLIIISRTKEELKNVFQNIEKEARTYGLEVNEGKTKYLVTTTKNALSDFKLNNQNGKQYNFEQVNSYVYLGAEINSENNPYSEIERRITLGMKSAGSLNKVIRNKHISRKVKIRIYKTIIRPTTLYGCEVWTLNQQYANKLLIWERKILRRIFGGIKEGEEWRRRTNEEVYELYKEPPITNIIKQSRLRWLGHLGRMTEERIPRRVFRETAEGRNRRGRPQREWFQDVKEDLKALKVKNWEELAIRRTEWKKIINKAKGL